MHPGSDRGGKTAATLMSLVRSGKLVGNEPFAYLRDVLDRVSTHPASRIEDLLPDRRVWPGPVADRKGQITATPGGVSRTRRNKGFARPDLPGVLGRGGQAMRVAIYARVSTHDRQALGMQVDAMSACIKVRGWLAAKSVEDIGSGAEERPGREPLLMAARRREIDAIVAWRLDRRGRSVGDPMTTLRELLDLGVGFVSLTEALDLTMPSGRAMAGMLAIFAEFEREILRERVKAGIARARKEGRARGRPRTASLKADEVLRLKASRLSESEIARRLGIGRASERRILAAS